MPKISTILCLLFWWSGRFLAGGSIVVKKWRVLGPFPIGKNELDGEPWLVSNASELLQGGPAKWQKLTAGTDGQVQVEWKQVDWNSLVQGVGGHEVLEWQALAQGSFKVERTDTALLSCYGVSAFRIDNRIAPLVGDQYSSRLPPHAIELSGGTHRISIRLRAKLRASFGCKVELTSNADPQVFGGPFAMLPDIVDGIFPSSLVTVPVFNRHASEWLINPQIEQVGAASLAFLVAKESTSPSLAPGQAMSIISEISASSPGCPKARIEVRVHGKLGPQIQRSPSFVLPQVRCRKLQESFVFTFLDEDGSVQHAAAIAPRPNAECPEKGCPVVLTLHGTSISASNSADSYKVKMKGDADYRFGVQDAWLLAPTRHGAHNWEGPGRATAFSALRALPAVASALNARGADVNRLLCAGHSMGGHGAWLLAIAARDAAIGLVTSASWLRKDQYADSNKILMHDVATPYVEPALANLLRAAESEYDVEAHAETLAGGLPILMRVGSKDVTVHPWFSRRMHRNLLAAGATSSEVTLTEVPGKEHWWWDTVQPNDGGAVNDLEIRNFMKAAISQAAGSHHLPLKWRHVVYNPASASSKGGARILQQLIPLRQSAVEIVAELGEQSTLQIQTLNVRRLAWASRSLHELVETHGGTSDSVMLDGQRLQIASKEQFVFWCNDDLRWFECEDNLDFTRIQRSPATLGPMRQLFSKPACAIFGDGDDKSMEAALYVANLLVMTGHGHMALLPASSVMKNGEIAGPRFCHHLLVVGGPAQNPVAGVLLKSRTDLKYVPPIAISDVDGQRKLTLDRCSWTGPDTAALALLPWWHANDSNASPRLALLAAGTTSEATAEALSILATPTIPPMTRQPLTHLLPDYVVADVASMRLKGAGGFLAAGYWGHRWQTHPQSSWHARCRTSHQRQGEDGRKVEL